MPSIDFIIITYNRPNETLALLKNIATLNGLNEFVQSIILIDNASTEEYTNVLQFIHEHKHIPVNYISSKKNLGVTGGRNVALQYATADILIFLDDDAELQLKDSLLHVIKAFEIAPYQNRETAIVSFKVLYYDTLEMQVNALPHKRFNDYKNKEQFYTYYFAGGAHAIKRKVLAAVGHLPEGFFYGMEEYDLSYRILNEGYAIQYNSGIVMLHKESPLGRKPKEEKLRMMWVNKSIVAWRYLPKKYFYTTAFMWSLQYLKETHLNLSCFLKGLKTIFKIPTSQNRTPIGASTLQYLKEVQARLWY
jgi:GT2 family glycosyltransferase